jgi:hypothetical protein
MVCEAALGLGFAAELRLPRFGFFMRQDYKKMGLKSISQTNGRRIERNMVAIRRLPRVRAGREIQDDSDGRILVLRKIRDQKKALPIRRGDVVITSVQDVMDGAVK